ncbi:MAG: hypothetical protein EPO62_02240 [Candidatus Nitrosotenuis sp.]|nr:MAG: hypothetical protein EPO62_02240 [Candidatus Nitrosotenuis sp.]
MSRYWVLMLCAAMLLVLPSAGAEVQIITSKKTYNYGDHLGISITVSSVTGGDATIHIINEDGTKSSAIPVQIRDAVTTITSPNPFDKEIFKEGKYQIEVEYAGQKGSVGFEIVDAGNTVLPFASNVVVPQWASSAISDYVFLKFLADNGVVNFQGHALKESTKIPSWYKTNGFWWADKKISDSEFVGGLQYLLDRNIIS